MTEGKNPETSLPQERIERVSERALTLLKALKAENKGHKQEEKDPLSRALSNLAFVDQEVMGIDSVGKFMTRTNKLTVLVGSHPRNIDSETGSIYYTEKGEPFITFRNSPSGMIREELLTPKLLQELWDQNIERYSIETFARMSRKDLILVFEYPIKAFLMVKSGIKTL